ncbi:MAG TPA: SLATT domain-containing protein [Methanoregulaceae archaeon]|nr:SLATT domain-containing protein [Methanoregulaceae archaeon]
MKIDDKLKYLENEVKNRKDSVQHRRNREKQLAFRLKISAVALAGLVTILIGLRISSVWSDLISNIALIVGASITVINAFDAFFDHRALWIYRTIVLTRLDELLRDIQFYREGLDPLEYDEKKVSQFLAKYNEILQEDLKSWLEIRQQGVPREAV